MQWEAVLSLVDQSRVTTKGSIELLTDLAIEVRDESGPIMQVNFKFHPLRKH